MTSRLPHSHWPLGPPSICAPAGPTLGLMHWRTAAHGLERTLQLINSWSFMGPHIVCNEARNAMWLTRRVTWCGGHTILDVLHLKNFTVCPIDGLGSPLAVYQAQLGLQRAFPFTASLNHICGMGSHPHPTASLPRLSWGPPKTMDGEKCACEGGWLGQWGPPASFLQGTERIRAQPRVPTG